jgi:hypothetical protein
MPPRESGSGAVLGGLPPGENIAPSGSGCKRFSPVHCVRGAPVDTLKTRSPRTGCPLPKDLRISSHGRRSPAEFCCADGIGWSFPVHWKRMVLFVFVQRLRQGDGPDCEKWSQSQSLDSHRCSVQWMARIPALLMGSKFAILLPRFAPRSCKSR